jgi:hypothetical protein
MRHIKSDAVALRDGEFCGREVGIRSLFPGKYGKFVSKSKLRGMTV